MNSECKAVIKHTIDTEICIHQKVKRHQVSTGLFATISPVFVSFKTNLDIQARREIYIPVILLGDKVYLFSG